MAHDSALKWAEEDRGLQTGFTTERTSDTVIVRGACPRCGGETEWTFRTGDMGSLSAPAGQDARPQTATVICSCGSAHPDRPADSDEDGCGAFWKVRFER